MTPDEAGAAVGSPMEEEIGVVAFPSVDLQAGRIVSLIIHLGDRLRPLPGAPWRGACTSAGYSPGTPNDTFQLTAAGAAVLADEEESLRFASGAFGASSAPRLLDDLPDAFGTGIDRRHCRDPSRHPH